MATSPALSDAERHQRSSSRSPTAPFFKLVHATTVVALYDDHEVWELLGYEGPSFDKGGYLHRGFDDLDWLPRPAHRGVRRPDRGSSSSKASARDPRRSSNRDEQDTETVDRASTSTTRGVVVIIGSGAGGGTVAYELATRAGSRAWCWRRART